MTAWEQNWRRYIAETDPDDILSSTVVLLLRDAFNAGWEACENKEEQR